eukprot:CFRG3492T1
MVLCNQAFVFGVISLHTITRVFFGALRPLEAELMYELAWFSVTEGCLAISVFREEFTPLFAGMLIVLHVMNLAHALLAARVVYMEQTPTPGRFFHVRVVTTLVLLFVIDAAFIAYAINSSLERGPSAQFMFGFEYLLLSTSALLSMARYALNLCESHNITSSEDRQVYLFYLGLCIDFVRMLVYTCFFSVIMSFYGLPLHIIRGLYISSKSFTKRMSEMLRFREATNNMNERYPDAAANELAAADFTCVICRENMESAKRLPCGHIFHMHCLRSWLQRQQICPICRSPVLESERRRLHLPHQIYLNAHAHAHVQTHTNAQPHTLAHPNEGVDTTFTQQNTAGVSSTSHTLPLQNPLIPTFGLMHERTSIADLGQIFQQPQPTYNCQNMTLEEIWTVVVAEEARFRARFQAIRSLQSDLDSVIQRHCTSHRMLVHPPPLPANFFKKAVSESGRAETTSLDAGVSVSNNSNLENVETVSMRRRTVWSTSKGKEKEGNS